MFKASRKFFQLPHVPVKHNNGKTHEAKPLQQNFQCSVYFLKQTSEKPAKQNPHQD